MAEEPDDGHGPHPDIMQVVVARLNLYGVLGALPEGPRLQRCFATALNLRPDELTEMMGHARDLLGDGAGGNAIP